MAMRTAIVDELKRALRKEGHTYTDVARTLNLSVASVKRLFSRGDFSLERLDRICELLGVELSELVEDAHDLQAPTNQLSLAQEKEIVADPILFLITWLLLSRTAPDEILKSYRFSAAELQRHLIRLDRLKVIELQPRGRVRVLVSRRFSWRRGGPVQRHINQKLLREFFASQFAEGGSEFFFHGDTVSDRSAVQLRRAIQNAIRECMEIVDADRAAPQERRGTAFLLAIRPWEYSGFVGYRRDLASDVARQVQTVRS
jgi:transcriptional regulator with XRE-family HTH domain